MTVIAKPLAEVTEKAIEILTRELGPVDTARFIGKFTTGFGNYTAERDAIFDRRSLDDIITDIKNTRKERSD